MTIDEAIKHCEEVADANDQGLYDAIALGGQNPTQEEIAVCEQCAADHRQLAEWLRELQQWRRVYGVCPSYEMCIPECREGYNAQIAEYKRLLRLAVDDFDLYGSLKDLKYGERIKNPRYRDFKRIFDILDNTWRYADEATELLNKEGDTE